MGLFLATSIGTKPHTGTVSSLGSASLIQRYELSLDVALLLLQRRMESAYGNRVVRVAWTDSSPIAGYDWIWSQYHAIAQVDVLKTFQAVQKLQCFSTFLAGLDEEEAGLDEEDKVDKQAAIFNADAKAPEHGWQRWLDVIKYSVHEHINPPAALERAPCFVV